MRRRLSTLPLLAALLPMASAQAVVAPPVCSDGLSTAAETRCLLEALQAVDRRLEQALTTVAAEARSVPGEMYQTLWRENLKRIYGTSTDPRQQAETFRRERQRVCAFAKSVAFQGSGYGVMTSRCELALSETLLEQLKP